MVMATSLIGYNQSASGKNTHIVGCSAINRRQHYCICVHFLRAVEEDRLKEEQFADCQQALKNGDCVAFNMREEEREAGVPIYFTPRAGKVPTASSKPEVKPTYRSPAKSPKLKPKSEDKMIGADMSAVINAAINEVNIEKPNLLIKPRKGESLMAFAVRYREANV